MPRAARRHDPSQTAERILEAALATFSEKGFEGAKTRDIAARADVTLGLVQYHFGTKEELWKAAVERAFGDLESGLELTLAESEGRNEEALLRAMIRAYVRFVAEHTAFIRIMHDEGRQKSDRSAWLADRYVKPMFERTRPVIERAQRNSGLLIADVDPGHLLYILVGAAGMFFHQSEEAKRVAGIDPSTPEAIEAHTRAVESLFLARAQPEDPQHDQEPPA